jgi:hypothetical protein
MITSIRSGADADLTSINAAFDVASADNSVHFEDVEGAGP